MQYADYAATRQRADAMERSKEPGRNFDDKYSWKLSSKYTTVQRPDKITFINGTIYRTYTPTTHIWYREKQNFDHNVWVEFHNGAIIVKNNIFVKEGPSASFSSRILYPNPDHYDEQRIFYDASGAVNYILTLN